MLVVVMKLYEWTGFDIYKIIPYQQDFAEYKFGVIHSLCEVDALMNSTPRLKEIFYPLFDWNTDQRSRMCADDLHYMFRSGNKEVLDYLVPYYEFLRTQFSASLVNPTNINLCYGLVKILHPFYEEHIENWLRLYDVLTEPYRPFSNYYLDEEMVRNEKTGTNNTTDASSTTSTNRSEGTSTDNENNSSSENTSGEVTNKVQGYNSTSFVDESKQISSEQSSNEYAGSSTSNSVDETTGSSTSDATRARTYEEQKAYLLRYTGALDVDFQEWINKEIELRRRQLINEVIFADLDEYLVKGVW